ncbi:MAG: amino acid ABC transporter ATP-binding protein [Puniceicoccales bacterium]|jgi:ABC-type polar amino acid transport system ATPase subunit|nr:amino acid ABC transporter ATP-binding protein [Puniceicoccales bacterium]
MLEVNKLSCNIGENTILSDISFKVLSGEICTIIGGSGAGKTTILRILCGLEGRFSGDILINNRKIHRNTHYFGLVPQGCSLFNHFTAIDNVAYALRKVKKYSKERAYTIATESLEKFGLSDKLSSYPSSLSGGQKQRVAIARTIVMKPKILLFDEPTSALDPEITRDVVDTIRILSATGMPIIVVTHDLSMARQIATRVIFLDNGNVIEDREAKEFFTKPHSERAKCFLGENI